MKPFRTFRNDIFAQVKRKIALHSIKSIDVKGYEFFDAIGIFCTIGKRQQRALIKCYARLSPRNAVPNTPTQNESYAVKNQYLIDDSEVRS